MPLDQNMYTQAFNQNDSLYQGYTDPNQYNQGSGSGSEDMNAYGNFSDTISTNIFPLIDTFRPEGTSFDSNAFYREYGDLFSKYDPFEENIAIKGQGNRLIESNKDLGLKLQEISGSSGFSNIAFDQQLKNSTDKMSLDNANFVRGVRDIRTSWEDELYATYDMLVDMDSFGEDSPIWSEEEVEDNYNTDPFIPDTNVPGGGDSGGGGGFNLCQDEQGNFIDCPPFDDPGSCDPYSEVWIDGYCVPKTTIN